MEHSTELDFARDVAVLGGRIAMGHFRREPATKLKSDGTWVTEADWTAEAQIRLRIARTWPDHNVLGEEEGLTGAGGGPPNEGVPTWVIDPIDGTNNFIAGIPIWATLVALQVEGRTVVGVCHAPALGETYEAAVGSGARLNGDSIEVAAIDSLQDALVLSAGLKDLVESGYGPFYEELARRCFRTRGFGDFWGHMLVARGAAHVMVEPEVSLWDIAALEPIITEAGGRVTHIDGSPWAKEGSCLTTCGSLHDEIVALARSYGDNRSTSQPSPERL